MKINADILKLLCPATIVGAALIWFNHEHFEGWGWQVLALCVAAVVSFGVGVFMQMHLGEQQ